MKILYNINFAAFLITLALYVTIVFGLYAQIVLGAIQVLSALVLFIFWKTFSKKTKEHIYIYWTLVIVYSMFWVLDLESFNETFIIIFGVMIIPMTIAGYFIYILNSIKHIKR